MLKPTHLTDEQALLAVWQDLSQTYKTEKEFFQAEESTYY